MKKLLVLLVALCLVLSACQNNLGGRTNEPEDPPEKTKIEEPETVAPPSKPPKDPEPPVEPVKPPENEKEIEEPPAKEPTAVSASLGELSSEWTSFQVLLDGVLFELPMPFSELAALGWEGKRSRDDLTEEISPNRYSSHYLIKDGNEVTAFIVNLSDNTIPINEGHVYRLDFDGSNVRNSESIILVLPGGVTIGTDMETVRSLYGDPTEERENNYGTTWKYRQGFDASVEFQFSLDDKLATTLRIENIYLKEPLAPSAPSGDIPDSVKNYKTPAALGNDYSSFNVKYADDLYTIPAPLSVFLENGWRMTDPSVTVASNSSKIGFSISKNNQTLRTNLYNYSSTAQPAENCFVYSIKSSGFGPTLPIEIPGGITMDSSLNDIIKAYGQPDKESNTATFDNYFYGKVNNGISITMNKETEKIQTIEVENRPRSLG